MNVMYAKRIIQMSILMLIISAAGATVSAEIDQQVVDKLTSITDKIRGFDSYQYKLTNITLKKKKQKKNVMMYYYKDPKNIRIEWLEPKKLRGQLAVYSGGVMKAAPSWLPFVVEVNPDSSLGMADFNYPIYQSTLGDLMHKVVAELPDAHTARVEEQGDGYIIYEVINPQNRARIKVDTETQIPEFIEQYNNQGQLVDGGYFDEFQANVTYPDDFFSL